MVMVQAGLASGVLVNLSKCLSNSSLEKKKNLCKFVINFTDIKMHSMQFANNNEMYSILYHEFCTANGFSQNDFIDLC